MTQAQSVAIESSQINSSGVLQPAGGGTGVTTSTGSGNNVLSASPTLSGTAVIPTINSGASTALTLQSAGATAITVDTSQNVGIGTTSAFGALNVNKYSSTPYSTITLGDIATPANGVGIYLRCNGTAPAGISTAGSPLAFYLSQGSAEAMRIDSSGNLLVGTTTSPSVSRNASAFSSNYWQYGASTTGSSVFWVLNSSNTGVSLTSGNTSWAAQSDERTKDIIEPISDAINKVSSLRAVIGKYKTDEEGIRRSFLIAQDVQKVLPEVIDTDTDEQGTMSIRYTEIIPLLVASIKELNAKVTALEAQLGK